ncbi:hypothetical protein [Blastococcus litoris]|uniref:hypothetical protein n=1 Tax=Blastococcus litoris TaxID=2171622 RepID=UPI000E3092CD|nr:hypothetical protein [Blastococcus litoris]
MIDWRDSTPQPVQDDLDGLVGPALDTAEQLLNENGEFFPFSLTLTADGGLGFVHGDPGHGERPPSQAVLEVLYDGAGAERDSLRAVAFVADVRYEGSDAVRVELEHRDGGPALAVLAPYSLQGLIRKRARFAALRLAEGTPRTWL